MANEMLFLLGFTGLYFLLVLAAVLFERIKNTGKIMPGLEEFFLASRNLNPVVLLCTYVASLFSAFYLIGTPGFVYTHGIGGVTFILAADLFGIFFILTLYKKLRAFALEKNIFSPIESLSLSYNSVWLGVLCALLMMLFMVPYISIQLVGIGKFLEGLSAGELGYTNGVGVMMAIVALYLFFGGMRAVAYTDFVQAMALLIGVFGGATFFIYINWGSFGAMMDAMVRDIPEHLTLPGPQGLYDWRTYLAVSIFPLATLFQPHLLTRAMMAKNDSQIDFMGFGLLFALLITVIPVTLFGLGGAMLFEGGVESNQIMGRIFESLTSASVIGLVFTSLILIGALGAAMSTADSLLIAIGQIFTRDITQPFFKLSQGQQVVYSKVIMMIVLAGAFITGLNPPEIMGELALYSSSATCTLVPTFMGFCWNKRSKAAAFSSILIGLATLVTLAVTETKLFGFHEGFITLITASVIYVLVCLVCRFKQGLGIK